MTQERRPGPLSLRDLRKQMAALQISERYFDSLLLFALLELGVFGLLADGGRDLDGLHAATGGDRETLRAVLDASVAVDVLGRSEEGLYTAPDDLVACLADERSPIYLGDWMRFLHSLVAPLSRQAEAVRDARPQASLVDGTAGDTRPARAMTRAMDAYARSRGEELARRFDFGATRRLLDVGCGPGTYSFAILEQHPHVHATLLDLPGPIAIARSLADERGLGDRVATVAQDALDYRPDERFDTVLVSNMLHMIGPEASRRLLSGCHDLVAPGGRIVVQAEYLDDERTSPRWATLLNLILRVATPGGRNHSVGETAEWLAAAGFVDVRHERLSALNVNSLLVGRRPG